LYDNKNQLLFQCTGMQVKLVFPRQHIMQRRPAHYPQTPTTLSFAVACTLADSDVTLLQTFRTL